MKGKDVEEVPNLVDEANEPVRCSRCGKPGEWALCPYDYDVNDTERYCDCCPACRQECADGI